MIIAPSAVLAAVLRFATLGVEPYSRNSEQMMIYLKAEVDASEGNTEGMAIAPENYKFKYKGMTEKDGRAVHVFQLTPRKKRVGLFKGDLWLDAEGERNDRRPESGGPHARQVLAQAVELERRERSAADRDPRQKSERRHQLQERHVQDELRNGPETDRHGEAEDRGIRGQATREQAEALADLGQRTRGVADDPPVSLRAIHACRQHGGGRAARGHHRLPTRMVMNATVFTMA